jgi:multifunctional methyltransferase subunit TRM112
MKLLTLNFLTCARKQCKPLSASFPLHPRDATLEYVPTSSMTSDGDSAEPHPTDDSEEDDSELIRSQVRFLENMLVRVEWPALRQICTELGMPVPWESDVPPEPHMLWETSDETHEETMDVDDHVDEDPPAGKEDGKPSKLAKDLHRLLLETVIMEGKLICGACDYEYAVKEGIANFLLPAHMV